MVGPSGVSHDGGATWSKSWPAFSNGAGGTAANGGGYERSSDPWVAFAPDGTLHAISISFDRSTAHNAVLTSRSTDGGDTWSPPTVLREDNSRSGPNANLFNDKESITADPVTAGNVYAVWDRIESPNNITGSNGHGIARGDNAAVIFSTDQGETWSSDATIIANMGDTGTRDPEPVNCTGDNTPSSPCLLVRTGNGIPDFAVAPNGDVYAVWQTHRSFEVLGNPVDDTIVLSRSTDGGHSWSGPVKVNHTPSGFNEQAFTPAVHVAASGDAAVTYYDFRNDVAGDSALSTDHWIAHCHAACDQEASWPASQENRLTPTSFDMRSAPYAIGYFLGDYEGLDNFGSTFTPFFVQAIGTHVTPDTDAYYTTAGP